MTAHDITHATPFHERHDDELLTLDQVAQILMTSENTVRWWRQILHLCLSAVYPLCGGKRAA